MKKLTKILLLSALGLNFIMLAGIIIFTEVNWNDNWILFMYGSIALLGIWLATGKVQPN
tara:strand:+ start:972 stop:1148 length:177 start_codon:yes stop_codon:yes gene_type:complete